MRRPSPSTFIGGRASRLELYGLFVAAVILIGGGIGGAIVITSDPAPVVVVAAETTTTSASIETTTTTTTGAPTVDTTPSSSGWSAPATIPPQTIPAQPVQDYSEYCTMPSIIGFEVIRAVAEVQIACGLQASGLQRVISGDCHVGPGSRSVAMHVVAQEPAAGTLIHRTLGTWGEAIAWEPSNAEEQALPVCP